ncbi:MAG: beta-ketoacyl-ACP synthase II [Deltaproteobacteria bacterium]|nr:beta-ketoacyl-ACP synthase II [Deltaproteobacteria bacterium]
MRRVVVTGMGFVTPVGIGTEATWKALCDGQSGIGPITQFDCSQFTSRIAGEVKGFEPGAFMEHRKIREMDRFSHFAVAASQLALADAGLQTIADEVRETAGVYIGVGLGGLATIETMKETILAKGPRKVSPYFIPAAIANLAAGQVSMRFGLRGPSYCTTSACSSGAHAIGEAYRTIVHGDSDMFVAGGSEATVTNLGVAGFTAMRALSTRNDEPTRASRPFDKGRDGFVISEGSGILVLEELEMARRRGARIYAEIVGYGASSDANHLTQPAPEGEGAQRAMRAALRDAKAASDRVTYINAHGTSTPIGDELETIAIKRVFGDHARSLWVSSTKSMTGHLLGAAGGLEAGIAAMTCATGIVTPTINLEEPDPECDLDYVPNAARERRQDIVLSNSFGFGGTNVTLAFTRFA